MDFLVVISIAIAAFLSAIIGGVVGIGTAIIMLPILAATFGVKETVPIISVAMTIANIARLLANWKEVDWKVVFWWCIGGMPTVFLGTLILVSVSTGALTRLLGLFFLVLVVYRYAPISKDRRMRLRAFIFVGAVQSTIGSLFGASGPLGAPFFLAYGLTRGAFVGTLGVANAVSGGSRLLVQKSFDILDLRLFLIGLAIGMVMFAGGFAGRLVVTRISEQAFVRLVEVVLIIVGLIFIIRG